MKMIKSILFIAALFLTVHASAQTDFSGSWKFTDQLSISGILYANGSPENVTIKQQPGSIMITKTFDDGNGTLTTATDNAGFNGKPVETTSASKKRETIKLTWNADKKSLTEFVQIYNITDPTKLEHTQTDIWTIENGNLILDRKDENKVNGEIWESRATYEKNKP